MRPNSNRISILLLILIAGAAVGLGQHVERNWYLETIGRDDYYSSYDFTLYTEEDVAKAVSLFKLVRAVPPANEWEGRYVHGTVTGEAWLDWGTRNGFVYHYVYHTLGSLDFGDVVDGADAVTMISRRSAHPKRKPTFRRSLVKVKFGDRRYLVPEHRLRDFAERAAGLSTSLEDHGYYFYKEGDSEKPLFGAPVLPKRFSRLVRSPITSRIIRMTSPRLRQDRHPDGELNYEEVFHGVTLAGGRDERIKVGMNFFVDDLNEWVEITAVNAKTSAGRIRRDRYEGRETCREFELGQGVGTPCKPIAVGMSARTRVSDAFF